MADRSGVASIVQRPRSSRPGQAELPRGLGDGGLPREEHIGTKGLSGIGRFRAFAHDDRLVAFRLPGRPRRSVRRCLHPGGVCHRGLFPRAAVPGTLRGPVGESEPPLLDRLRRRHPNPPTPDPRHDFATLSPLRLAGGCRERVGRGLEARRGTGPAGHHARPVLRQTNGGPSIRRQAGHRTPCLFHVAGVPLGGHRSRGRSRGHLPDPGGRLPGGGMRRGGQWRLFPPGLAASWAE